METRLRVYSDENETEDARPKGRVKWAIWKGQSTQDKAATKVWESESTSGEDRCTPAPFRYILMFSCDN